MTIQEYIDGNNPFYHITNMESLESILNNGLFSSSQSGCRHGICVVRSIAEDIIAEDIIAEIIDRQLQNTGHETFAIIKLLPSRHHFTAKEVSEDPIDEVIAPMCNYICQECITIQGDDVVKRGIPVGLWRGTNTEIVELTDYLRDPPPING